MAEKFRNTHGLICTYSYMQGDLVTPSNKRAKAAIWGHPNPDAKSYEDAFQWPVAPDLRDIDPGDSHNVGDYVAHYAARLPVQPSGPELRVERAGVTRFEPSED